MISHASVAEARAAQLDGHTYVDVRSTEEFEQAHPAGAVNVPIFDHDPDTGQMAPNPDFVRVMQATFRNDQKLLLGCQAGMRSMRAAQVLETFGFSDLVNVKGGFGGTPGDRGWADAGLPVEIGDTPGARYADVLSRADAAGA